MDFARWIIEMAKLKWNEHSSMSKFKSIQMEKEKDIRLQTDAQIQREP